MKKPIKDYLARLERDLWRRGISDADSLAEVESHLYETVEDGQRHGLALAEAEQRAVERFGRVEIVAAAFEKERKRPMQKLLLILGLLVGILIAYVDSRPTWDDTGITVGSMLLSSGLFTLLGYRKPWLMALVIGSWTPVYETFVSRNFALPGVVLFPVVVLSICLVGAYSGWAVHQGIRRARQPA